MECGNGENPIEIAMRDFKALKPTWLSPLIRTVCSKNGKIVTRRFIGFKIIKIDSDGPRL